MKVIGTLEGESLAYPGEQRKWLKIMLSDGDPHDAVRALRACIDADNGSKSPFINELASSIVAHAPARNGLAEASAILAYVQSKMRYTTEGPEMFRNAEYIAKHGFGDCDDGVILCGSLCESIGIPIKVCILDKPSKLFFREAFHAYLRCGLPPRAPQEWLAMETTLPVPIGWEPLEYAKQHPEIL